MKTIIPIFLTVIFIFMMLVAGCKSSPDSFTREEAEIKIKTMKLGGKSMEPTIKDGTRIKVKH
jgi:hypothetical protein